MKFKEFNLCLPLQKALTREWFEIATEIQKAVIPIAEDNKDILGTAQTWSGKTLAFVLPVLDKIYKIKKELWLEDWVNFRKIKTLVLAPTRELAEQIWETFKPYCTNVNVKHFTIYWWVNDFHQKKAIEKWIDILIATPGRLMDLVSQNIINLSFVENLILDEADRMLDMWNAGDISKIIKRLRWPRQTMLFSATMPKKIKDLADNILQEPEIIEIDKPSSNTLKIAQKVYFLKSSKKRQALQQIIKRKDLKSILVFVRSRLDAERILSYVKTAWIPWNSIHKDKTQNQRKKSLELLKSWEIKVLVATDIASRWLDVDSLSCVINYDIPNNPDDYIHRIGRTGRAWKEWLSISLVSDTDKEKLEEIEKLIWKKLKIIDDESYKLEIVPKEIDQKKYKKKKIWRTNFTSNNDSRFNKSKKMHLKGSALGVKKQKNRKFG